MPPRSASNRGGSRGSAPSAPSARGSARGRGAGRGVVQTGGVRLPVGLASGAPIKTIGVKRPGFGTAGKKLEVITNNYEISHPDVLLRHYDVGEQKYVLQLERHLKSPTSQSFPPIFTPVFAG
ncbi:hypothetical protein H0H92_003166 [Tricholoma furcatifolium]|nr:hypothetical protein H0H92_003166 [Tricholoma furcatifolium]